MLLAVFWPQWKGSTLCQVGWKGPSFHAAITRNCGRAPPPVTRRPGLAKYFVFVQYYVRSYPEWIAMLAESFVFASPPTAGSLPPCLLADDNYDDNDRIDIACNVCVLFRHVETPGTPLREAVAGTRHSSAPVAGRHILFPFTFLPAQCLSKPSITRIGSDSKHPGVASSSPLFVPPRPIRLHSCPPQMPTL